MKSFLWLGLFLSVVLVGRAEPEYPAQGPDIYDTKADGAVLIGDAVQQANLENKRVLLDFGANWCPWCRRLHKVMTEDPEVVKELADHYIVVMIDVNTRKGEKRNVGVNRHYENPIEEGLPVLLVLNQKGRVLMKKETGAFEKGDHHDPALVLAFLKKWDTTGGK